MVKNFNPLIFAIPIFFILCLLSPIYGPSCINAQTQEGDDAMLIKLPEPVTDGEISLEQCLASRRSVRSFSKDPLTMEEISQLMWAAQGITNDRGFRTAPSAGALYPMMIFIIVENANDLKPGVYEYVPKKHSIKLVVEGNFLKDLSIACVNQECISNAPAAIIISAFSDITRAKYGDRTMRYVDNEAGAICENIYLQCQALGLGTVSVGAFDDASVAEIAKTKSEPRLVMPIGHS